MSSSTPLRAAGVAAAALLLVSSAAGAQARPAAGITPRDTAHDARGESARGADPRAGFADSWFWGVKGGALRFGTATEGRVTVPTYGAEWLITRTRAALLVSAEQASFTRTSALGGAGDSALVVSMRNARRFAAAAVAAPTTFGPLRPYAGVGVAVELVDRATPQDAEAQTPALQAAVDAAGSNAAFFFLAGAQAQLGRVALFGQGSVAPAQPRTLFNLGRPLRLEGGVRFNLSSATER